VGSLTLRVGRCRQAGAHIQWIVEGNVHKWRNGWTFPISRTGGQGAWFCTSSSRGRGWCGASERVGLKDMLSVSEGNDTGVYYLEIAQLSTDTTAMLIASVARYVRV